MSFAQLLAEVKNLSPSEKEALRSFLAGDLLNQEETEEFLTQLDSDAAHAVSDQSKPARNNRN